MRICVIVINFEQYQTVYFVNMVLRHIDVYELFRGFSVQMTRLKETIWRTIWNRICILMVSNVKEIIECLIYYINGSVVNCVKIYFSMF